MRKYVASSPNAELIGGALLALVKNVNHEDIEPLLKKHGLENIQPMQWYPEQPILDLLKAIADGETNVSENMVAIGIKAIETIPFPVEIDTLEKFIGSYGTRQKASSRNTTAILVSEVLGQGHGRVVNDTPYPDDLIFGYLWGASKRFLPRGKNFSIKPQAKTPGTNDEPVVFDVTWEV